MIKKIKRNELCLYDEIILNNEKQSKDCLDFCREEYDFEKKKVYYISDIHIFNKVNVKNKKAEWKYIIDFTDRVINRMLSSFEQSKKVTILIAGDVTYDIRIFEKFVKILRYELNEKCIFANVVFVLGNHELCGMGKFKLEGIIAKYKKIINDNGMYLLQNELIYFDKNYDKKHHKFWDKLKKISYNELNKMQIKQIEKKLSNAEVVILGGVGFSGYNDELNAEKRNIYGNVLNRKQEIKETKKFECLYNKLYPILIKKNTIILTHMPKSDWSSEKEYDDNLIYINGHTHKNDYFISDKKRIYSDNQIGYKNKKVKLKYFYIDNSYDTFDNLGDCIKTITCDEYNEFLKGKNIGGGLSVANKIWMLKKNGYYLFIHEDEDGSKAILYKGYKNKKNVLPIEKYYENMDKVISCIKKNKEYNKYCIIQQKVSNEIMQFNGNGSIHGAVVDIDSNNHVFINPNDGKISFYSAPFDMKDKKVYPDLYTLLSKHNRELFRIYKSYIKNSGNKNLLISVHNNEISTKGQYEEDTIMYKDSNKLCKMQILNKKVLAVWGDVDNIIGFPLIEIIE